MNMTTKLQGELKSLRDQALNMEAANGDGQWSAEALEAYKGVVTRAEKVREQIDAQTRMDAVKMFGESSDGKSVINMGFGRDATYGEGSVPGVTDDGTGELTAYSTEGETRLKILKSASYKDAFASHLRMKSKYGGEWRSGMNQAAMKVLMEGSDEAGGFWIPPDYRAELIKKSAAMATVRPNATVITTGSDIVNFPTVKYMSDQKYTSGVRFAWNGEVPSGNISESTNPVAGRDLISINVATAAIFLSRSMMEDKSFDVLGYISELMSEAFTLGEEDAFWNAAGDGQPEGIFSHPMASVADGTGDGMLINSGHATGIIWGATNAPTAPVTKGLLGLEAALPPQYEYAAQWFANKKTYGTIRGLTDDQKRPLWQQSDAPGLTNYVRGLPATLLGYPIQKSQFLPDLGTAGNKFMAFGDMKGYYIADRVGLSIEVFREVLGLRDLVAIYARKRVGGGLLHPWRMKIMQAAA
jgi:HK97 family phage major capsid protein